MQKLNNSKKFWLGSASKYRLTWVDTFCRCIEDPFHTIWLIFIQFLFTKSPLNTTNVKESGPTYCVICSYELSSDGQQKVVKDLLEEWTAMCNLYSIVEEFAHVHNGM